VRLAILICALIVSGCATTNDCADPYSTGVRDGVLNTNQTTRLGSMCSGFNEARYREGFDEGFSRRGRVYSL
jgi:hypothetical protein